MQGILMKPDMIAATVEGRKTNTRRADASLREINKEPDEWELMPGHDSASLVWGFRSKELSEVGFVKPRYHAGETCYIKEAWQVDKKWDNTKPSDIPHGESVYYPFGGDPEDKIPAPYWLGKLRSPLFMPEWAARHFPKILAVRAERLQEITKQDIRAEGFDGDYTNIGYYYVFGQAWNSINPKHPWESNPWVWRYQFRLES